MSSIHSDKGWLLVSFMVWNSNERIRARLYPGIRDTREGRRSPVVKEIRAMIDARRWDELARLYPQCKALAPFRSEVRQRDATTFRQASERFLVFQRNTNSQNTVAYHEQRLRLHICSVSKFADKPLKLISAGDVSELLGLVRQSSHRGLEKSVRTVISAVFNWARGERGTDGEYLATDNPVSRLRRVKVDRPEGNVEPFTPEEVRQIIAAAKPGEERRIITVAIGAGLRPNENFGLKPDNVDLEGRVIRIRQTYSDDGQGPLKTARSRRDVNMTEPVYCALRDQLLNTVASPWLWPVSRWHPKPSPTHKFSSHLWRKILKRAGVKHRHFYQCRHTFATLLLQGSADWRYVADQMGHVDLRMLQKHYWKWRPGSIAAPAVDPIAEAFSNDGKPIEAFSSYSSPSDLCARTQNAGISQARVLSSRRHPQLHLW